MWRWFVRMAMLYSLMAFAADPPGFQYHPENRLRRMELELVTKVDGDKPVFTMLHNAPRTKTALIHRAATGEAELHDRTADIFVVRSGEGTLMLGGKMVEQRTISAGEHAAKSLAGADARALRPGDIVHIPAALPHHVVVEPGKSITYVIVKVSD